MQLHGDPIGDHGEQAGRAAFGPDEVGGGGVGPGAELVESPRYKIGFRPEEPDGRDGVVDHRDRQGFAKASRIAAL